MVQNRRKYLIFKQLIKRAINQEPNEEEESLIPSSDAGSSISSATLSQSAFKALV